MARPKLIEDGKAIELIKKYFNSECNNDIKKLNTTDIVIYINQHGYPKYNAAILRRSPEVTKYIDGLKKAIRNDDYITTASYQTLDAASFVDNHRSRESLIKAITDRDIYYKAIADSATQSFNRYNALLKNYEDERLKRSNLEVRVANAEEQLKAAKDSIKQLRKELTSYKSLVDNYVYPEIANELLLKEGAIRQTKEILEPDVVDQNLISSGTNIRKLPVAGNSNENNKALGDNIISNMFI